MYTMSYTRSQVIMEGHSTEEAIDVSENDATDDDLDLTIGRLDLLSLFIVRQ